MKKIPFLIIALLFLLACGNTKNVIENTTPKENAVEIQSEIPLLIKEDIGVKGENWPLILTEEKVESLEENAKKTNSDTLEMEDLGFHQILKKRFYENHELWDQLLKKHVSDSGNVDYIGFKQNSKDLSTYIKMLQMAYQSIYKYTKNQQLAYWINAYNALTIDLILRNYPLKSIKDIKDPWDQRLWKFGDKWINLNTIEHEILREMDEPRIHFAIVCASVSCPKLQNKAFEADTLETQLTEATKEFLEDTDRNEINANDIKISKIFRWFAKDFKTNGSIIDFINQYTDVNISNNAKTSFMDYDWGLND
jgi:hypothetical protein